MSSDPSSFSGSLLTPPSASTELPACPVAVVPQVISKVPGTFAEQHLALKGICAHLDLQIAFSLKLHTPLQSGEDKAESLQNQEINLPLSWWTPFFPPPVIQCLHFKRQHHIFSGFLGRKRRKWAESIPPLLQNRFHFDKVISRTSFSLDSRALFAFAEKCISYWIFHHFVLWYIFNIF